ncbi:MAG: zinc carboxypeptidase [Cyclobacteriaceae bacterium]|nr:zinc carboxypeptidase [Cyclobacteriaceae bacterium]
MKKLFLLLLVACPFLASAQASYFYPKATALNKNIPTPEAFLGYPIGSHHTRHDKIVEYFKLLDQLSDRFVLEEIGQTIGHRVQIVAKITSPANHARLEEIRKKNLENATDIPLVIQLGYNVHGNEPSSSEAAMLTAYYLAASEEEETLKWMNDLVILLDPVYNPDGRDRHTHWANMHKGTPPVSDPLDREHTEAWPGGRTNHYWFDLNRDWFLGVHPESQNRIKFFHQWRPYLMTDHHEMGTTSTFYFDPGKYTSNNPIVPPYIYDVVHPKFAEYFSKGMNSIGSMYFTEEAYDKLYPGYGSSYVNFYGGIGFLFEQASSRGHVQETSTIPITFGFTIRNQFTASLATLRGAAGEKEMLRKLRQNFFSSAMAQAKASPIKGYVFGDPMDASRTNAFINLLLMHQVEVYELGQSVTANGKTFEKSKTYVVPTEQTNYIMVRSAFEKDITYRDSTFYDASTWSLVHAFNMPHAELRAAFTKGNRINATPVKVPVAVSRSEYAYLADMTDYQAHKAIYQLQQSGVIVRSSFKPFSMSAGGAERPFQRGALVIPVQQQKLDSDKVYEAVKKVSTNTGLDFFAVDGGLTSKGIDLGSGSVRTIPTPKVLMPIGNGLTAGEAGEVWHVLDQRLGMPITKVDMSNFGRVNLNNYNVLVMVGGNYPTDKPTVDRIKSWVQGGGTLITLKTASEWAIRQGIVKEKLVPIDTIKNPKRVDFEWAADTEGARQIGGSIFQVDLDVTNPLGFGFTDRKVSIYRNGRTYLQPSKSRYSTVAQYGPSPLIGGYIHKAELKKVANSAAILLSTEGQGRVILFSDNPNFRGTWYGTNKLFFNALFFGPILSLPGNFGFGEEE